MRTLLLILFATLLAPSSRACEMDAAYGGHDAYVRWLAQQINSRDKSKGEGSSAPTRSNSSAGSKSNLDDDFFRSSAPAPEGGRSSGGRYQAE